VVLELLKDFNGVISLGGGAPINPKIESVLAGAEYPVIFLDVTIAQAAVRIGFNKERPLLLVNPRQQWISLMSTRRGVYEKLATKTISTDSKKPADAAAEIVSLLGINA
jgi:shikimate kinase